MILMGTFNGCLVTIFTPKNLHLFDIEDYKLLRILKNNLSVF